jgi:8-oxo-dGTP pyrophosphatase MutT (NUDIX family)
VFPITLIIERLFINMADGLVKITASVLIPIQIPFRETRFWFVKDRDDKKWGPPGGRPHKGESPIEAAQREALQELDVDVRLESCLGLFLYSPKSGHDVYKCIFVGRIVNGRPKPDHRETSKARLFSYQGIQDLYRQGDLRAGDVYLRALDYFRANKKRYSIDFFKF